MVNGSESGTDERGADLDRRLRRGVLRRRDPVRRARLARVLRHRHPPLGERKHRRGERAADAGKTRRRLGARARRAQRVRAGSRGRRARRAGGRDVRRARCGDRALLVALPRIQGRQRGCDVSRSGDRALVAVRDRVRDRLGGRRACLRLRLRRVDARRARDGAGPLVRPRADRPRVRADRFAGDHLPPRREHQPPAARDGKPVQLAESAPPVMISSNDFRNGVTIVIEGQLWTVIEFLHVKPGKGAAFVRTRLKNVKTGSTVERTFRAGEKLERATVDNREMQMLYNDADGYHFRDNETYENFTLQRDVIGDPADFLKDGMKISVQFHDTTAIGADLPAHVELKVEETDPGFKGDTATGATKPAKLETGATVNVPLFVNPGDVIRIDTRDRRYIGRVQN